MARRIPLKTLGSADDTSAPHIDYSASLVSLLLNSPGMAVPELRARGKIADRIEECPDTSIVLEDAEYAILKSAVDAMSWRSAHRHIREFLDDIDQAEKVEIK